MFSLIFFYWPSIIPFTPTNQIYTPFCIVSLKKKNQDSSLIYINYVQNWISIKGMLKVTCRVTSGSNINICGTFDQPKISLSFPKTFQAHYHEYEYKKSILQKTVRFKILPTTWMDVVWSIDEPLRSCTLFVSQFLCPHY